MLIQRVEIDRLQHELGETAPLDRIRNRLTGERVQHVGAEAADQRAHLFLAVTAALEKTGLVQFDEENRFVLVLDLRVDRDRQYDLVQ